MARVFISHSSEDAVLAAEIHGWLVDGGHEAFLDQDLSDGILTGEDWERRLHERLRWADAVVCLLTSAYLVSVWCTAELAIAQSRGSRLLPVRAEHGVRHPLLNSIQYTDMTDAHAARARLAEALQRVDAVGGLGWPDRRSPFPGLRPLDMDQHRVFFGRSAEVNELAGLLRSPAEAADGAVMVVVGPSGCGKSSLVRAGLLPVMADDPDWWTLGPMLPGADPLEGLSRELAAAARQLGIEWTVSGVRGRLDNGGLATLADDLLVTAPPPRRRRLLVVIDQLEELLTQTSAAERSHFVDLLHPTLGGPVQVVATLRPEFFDLLLVSPELHALPTHTFALRPLSRDALSTVIEEPARLAGIGVDEDLVARLVSDTGSGEALPLLAYTLSLLSNGVGRGGRLSDSRYAELGGVQGTLVRQAEAALAEAMATGGRSQDDVIRSLLRLVTVDEHGRPARWRVLRAELPAEMAVDLEPFVARRLLTTDTDNGETGATIEMAHEAFLTEWAPLAEAVTANASALRAHHRIEQAANEWSNDGHPPGRLWEHGQLASALNDIGAQTRSFTDNPAMPSPPDSSVAEPNWRNWRPRRRRTVTSERIELSAQARDFLQASIRRDRLRRGRSTAILTTLLAIAVIGLGFAIYQNHNAQKQATIATARQLAAQADTIRDTNPRTAIQLGIAANRIYPSKETEASVVNILTNTRYGEEFKPRRVGQPLKGHTDMVSSVRFNPNGMTLATASADGTARLWDVSDPARPSLFGLLRGQAEVSSVSIAPDGHTVATGGADVRLWDVASGRLVLKLGGHTAPVKLVQFSPDGYLLATAGTDGRVILWRPFGSDDPKPLDLPVNGPAGDIVSSLAFAPDQQMLAIGNSAGTVTLCHLADLSCPTRLDLAASGYSGPVNSLAFTPDGRTLATGDADGAVTLWDLKSLTPLPHSGPPLTERSGPVGLVEFLDQTTMAIVGSDGRLTVWDLTEPAQPHRLGPPLAGQSDTVLSIDLAPDKHTLAAGTSGAEVILWDLTGLNQLRSNAVAFACSIVGRGMDRAEWARYVSELPYQDTCPA
jgi:WD40 repeat protein